MKKRKTNPKAHNALLLVVCIVLFLVLGSLLVLNHKQEAVTSGELKKAAQEEIQKEKTDQTWTKNQNSEDQSNTDQTDESQNSENQNNGDTQENAGENSQQ